MVPFKVDLSKEVVVVTGGSGILCSCMAKALAECGAKVVVASRRQEAVDKVAFEIRATGGIAMGIALDVLDKASVERANILVEKEFGVVTLLINGAGGNNPKGNTSREYLLPEDLKGETIGVTTFFDLDPKGIELVFNLNFQGTLIPTQVFTRGMAKAGRGTVINITSMSAMLPLTKVMAYGGAKAAVSNFTQWLAVHMSKVGIRVNAIAPGFFLTEQNRTLLTQPDGSLTARGNTIVAHTPMSKFGRPEDLTGVLLWLASQEASGFVTGIVIPVDGGFSAFSGV
ncbi:MAG: SDR family oxidoreductase [bacterium]|jgi:NAD(P)-dependent dehydrogenase (short-subunit alcohol dehydrogenase family)